jgi:hypothetical protein
MYQNMRLVGIFIILAIALGAVPAQPAASQPGERCFSETGFCISGRIQEFWEQHDGLTIFGLPITPLQTEMLDGEPTQVQWFERNRLELHPENNRPHDVLIGRLGVIVLEQHGRDWFAFPRGEAHEGCLFFDETGHSLCEPFLSYWRAYGLELDGQRGTTQAESQALFGMPISEPRVEQLRDGQQYTVQWFERARLEHHPDNPPSHQVMTGRLGAELNPQAHTAPRPIHGTVRVINNTGWRVHFSLSALPYQGPWVVNAGETYDLAVEPGMYRLSISTTCGGTTEDITVLSGETEVLAYACSSNRLLPAHTP